MPSYNDILFLIWIAACLILITLTPGKISKSTYSKLMAAIFLLSCLMLTWFHETVVDISASNSLHGALIAFAQVATLTLSSKMWLKINFHLLSKSVRLITNSLAYGALLAITIFAYWFYKSAPELQLLLYPLASLAIAITTEILEDRWHK